MKAVVASERFGVPIVVTDKPRPKLKPTRMLVRTVAVAVNPADALYLDFGEAAKGSLLGCDYAGVVEEVGPEVIRDFKKGDRVCGCTRAGDTVNLENGTAAEYIVVKADLALHIPGEMSFEDASTTGVTFLTVGRCLVSDWCYKFWTYKPADTPEVQSLRHPFPIWSTQQ
jgi:NADPH:quinone reductase-like Zn-dependent oxidoreductase